MGTCGAKNKSKNKMKEQVISTNQNNGIQNQEQNIKTNREGDIAQQVQQTSDKQDPNKEQIEDKVSQINQEKNNIQEDYSKLSEVLPMSTVGIHPTTTPIIQISKKKVQDDDFAKHHLEV
ncbi:unnamed protein product (macronuclear) [Paramecium tetraurelia]|uniref:Uncharacterized protein n=1 Tax=Paramecium tetraurelia TaxID=5888 RepID=A0CMI3_PARTE|nr:uncharacterized protein GSPATT00008479001 [Paramecium tetraurelia]CAK72000.1 unnamed protein product [Paramecium tetraurelia]|eukprot:XP_001439397.1 hypothetical protein (macronuclear) [Paramecium tetraurelia strain d4-2]